MEYKLEANQYNTLEDFLRDAKYIFDNCRSYNAESSNYVRYFADHVNVYTNRMSNRLKMPTSSKLTSAKGLKFIPRIDFHALDEMVKLVTIDVMQI